MEDRLDVPSLRDPHYHVCKALYHGTVCFLAPFSTSIRSAETVPAQQTLIWLALSKINNMKIKFPGPKAILRLFHMR